MKHLNNRRTRDQMRQTKRLGAEVADHMRPRISPSARAIGVQPRPRERTPENERV